MREIHLTNNPLQTKKLGAALAKKIFKNAFNEKALILGLTGNLGGGKTTFLQGFAKGLGIKEKILSPTFIIIRKSQIPQKQNKFVTGQVNPKSKFRFFYHIDCYRIQKPKDISDLGFKEIISNPKNVVAIEWAERIKKILPRNTIWIKFEFAGENTRKIMLK